LKSLQRAGFVVTRIKGGHHFPTHPDGRCATIPVHSGEVIGIGLFMKIMKNVDMTAEEFPKFT
jgi:predicted RNA binding protein YcfA (HicA-like mRNA interferase family)